MFDKHYLTRPAEVRVNITQQPNDAADAARLFGECTERARKDVAAATIASFGANNELKVLVIHHERSNLDRTVHTRVLFSLNGHQYDVDNIEPEKWNKPLANAIADSIATKVYQTMVRK